MNGSTTIPELLGQGASRWPDRPLVRFEGGTSWTWRESLAAALVAASALAEHGVGPGDRVMIMLPNGEEWLRTWWGAALLGAVIAPVNPAYRGQMLADVCATVDPSVIAAEDDVAARLPDRWAARRIVPSGLAAATSASPPPEVRVRPSDVHCLLLTSGTTGPSKASISTHAFVCDFAAWMVEAGGLSERSVFQADMPWFHLSALAPAVQMMRLGGTVVVRPGPAMATYWQTAKELGTTFAVAPGTVAQFLESAPPSPGDRDHGIEFLLSSPLPSDPAGFVERFGLRGLCTAYGSTEANLVITNALRQPLRAGSCGTARPGFELRIVDDVDAPVPAGTVGELIVRSDRPWVQSLGYQGDPEATVRAWRNGWYHTGDALSVDEDGYYYFHDRYRDSLRRRGENISSFEVEREVLAFPGVAEAACVAHPGRFAGDDEVKVFVVPEPGVTIDFPSLLGFLADRVAPFMLPRFLEVVDAFPKTPTLRVQKHVLRARGNGEATYDRLAAPAGRPAQPSMSSLTNVPDER